jgi:TubC N-terminal docking domain
MTALDLFLHLTEAGCQLTRQGETLRVHDPQRLLTDTLRDAIRQHKAALLAMLTPERRMPLPRLSGSLLALQRPK